MDRRLTTLLGNGQRLDGGAMFGNAPKALWSRWIAPDADNRIALACRALLVEEPGRTVLCETGIGAFLPPALRDRYGVVSGRHDLLDQLATLDLTHADVDVVVLSHLHFDHAGGLLAAWEEGQPPRLLFPNATFVVGRAAWARACDPHPRDRASFIPELPDLLTASGRLAVVDDVAEALGDGWRSHRSDGHTPGLLLSEVELAGRPVVFGGDLVPGTAWVHAPITMGYDRFPELLVDEKIALLATLADRDGWLVYTHDTEVACSGIGRDARGRFVPTAPVPALLRQAA